MTNDVSFLKDLKVQSNIIHIQLGQLSMVKQWCFFVAQLTNYKPAMKKTPGPMKAMTAMKAMKVKAATSAMKVCKRPSTASRTTKSMKVARTTPKAFAKPKAKGKSKAKTNTGNGNSKDKDAVSPDYMSSSERNDETLSPLSPASSDSSRSSSPCVKTALDESPASVKDPAFNAGATPELCRITEYQEEDSFCLDIECCELPLSVEFVSDSYTVIVNSCLVSIQCFCSFWSSNSNVHRNLAFADVTMDSSPMTRVEFCAQCGSSHSPIPQTLYCALWMWIQLMLHYWLVLTAPQSLLVKGTCCLALNLMALTLAIGAEQPSQNNTAGGQSQNARVHG